MKIRNGYVSNSSSSSFCILGIAVDKSSLKDKIKNLPEDCSKYEDYAENIAYDLKLHAEDGIYTYLNFIVFGVEAEYLPENKTILESRKEIFEKLNTIFNNVFLKDVVWRIDGGYNG